MSINVVQFQATELGLPEILVSFLLEYMVIKPQTSEPQWFNFCDKVVFEQSVFKEDTKSTLTRYFSSLLHQPKRAL